MKIQTLKDQIGKKINCSKRQVFLRADFKDLGGYDQVGRSLNRLVKEKRLIKFGYGLYAKARLNRLSGKPMLAAIGGFDQVAKESLTRLKKKWKESDATVSYQAGGTQIPANTSLVVIGRFNRKIGTDKFKLRIKKVS
ncbi:MAG: DUF6088 family protein [Gammaproteobacteria bacterium]